MSDEPALLAAILAHPDEDTPRLVYADWLDENDRGDRAEFIRVQCRIAEVRRDCGCGGCVFRRGGGQHHNGPCAAGERQDDGVNLRHAERLLMSSGRKWWSAYGPGQLVHVLEWRRGFVSHIAMPAGDWLHHADEILSAHPVERVALSTWHDAFRIGGDRPHQSLTLLGPPLGAAPTVGRGDRKYHKDSLRALKLFWPRIEFTIPLVSGGEGAHPLGSFATYTAGSAQAVAR